jgi:hypothetical protein
MCYTLLLSIYSGQALVELHVNSSLWSHTAALKDAGSRTCCISIVTAYEM